MTVMHPKSEVWLVGDLAGMLRGLALSVESMPPSEYRTGYLAALRALGVSVGVIDRDDGPVVIDVAQRSTHTLTGWEELGPGSFGAFGG